MTMDSTALAQATLFHLDPSTHSGRLKYANAQDLPSFPSSGLKKDGTAASAAASLGWASSKSPQLWAPGASVAASAAALLANSDGKMAPSAESRRSNAGSQAAAFATGSSQRHQPPQPPQPPQPAAPSVWGSSAANLAYRASMSSPPAAEASTSLARQGSVRAAQGAMAGLRPRARSSPMFQDSYPDQANAASNALSAATIAHRPYLRVPPIPIEEAGAVPYTTMDRQMFTATPPVKLEIDERRHNDVLHASAVAMAKQMYSLQQSVIDTNSANAHARSSSFSRHGSGSVADEDEQPMVFSNLQEAAYKLAQQRLAKLQDEHQKNRDLQAYYGSSNLQQRNTKLGNIRSKLTRRRSASDGALVEDKNRSQQIRKQMSMFDTKLAEVDEQKRARDREALMAAAQRNVQARLKGMDEKIQAETGWVAPHTASDWDWKARAAAQARFDAASRTDTTRKIDVGGGKFMDRDAVEAIAAQRVQPLLDEINEKAELERERKALQKAEEDRQKEDAERNRMREKEVQEIHKKLKEQQNEQDRARKAMIKQEEKLRKEEEKAARAEQKRLAKDEKHKEKELVPTTTAEEPPTETVKPKVVDPVPNPEPEPATSSGQRSRALSINFIKRHSKQKSKDSTEKSPTSDKESASPHSNKVKTWLKTRFPRPRAHSSPTPADEHRDRTEKGGGSGDSGKKKFIGGAALAKLRGRNGSSPSVDDRRSASMRDVSFAGRGGDEPGETSSAAAAVAAPDRRGVGTPSPITTGTRGVRDDGDDSTSLDSRSVSSLSSDDKFEEAQTTLSPPVSPPGFLRAGPEKGRASPLRGSRFSEIIE